MLGFFKKQWKKNTQREHDSVQNFWTFKLTPLRFALNRLIHSSLSQEEPLGRVLDIGAGTLLYKDILSNYASEYTSCDKYSDHDGVDDDFDVVDLKYADDSFDTVFCNQVLEHVPDTLKALTEIKRVVRPGGKIFIGVPFHFYLHAEPHDYFRFTEFGLKYLLGRSEIEIDSIQSVGGYFSTFAEPANIIFTSFSFNINYLKHVINGLNFIFFVLPAFCLDRLLRTSKKFPAAYWVVAKKPVSLP